MSSKSAQINRGKISISNCTQQRYLRSEPTFHISTLLYLSKPSLINFDPNHDQIRPQIKGPKKTLISCVTPLSQKLLIWYIVYHIWLSIFIETCSLLTSQVEVCLLWQNYAPSSVLTGNCHQNKINRCDISDNWWLPAMGLGMTTQRGGRRNINNSFFSRIYKTQILNFLFSTSFRSNKKSKWKLSTFLRLSELSTVDIK